MICFLSSLPKGFTSFQKIDGCCEPAELAGRGVGVEFQSLNVAMANGYWLYLRPVSQEGSGYKKLFF